MTEPPRFGTAFHLGNLRLSYIDAGAGKYGFTSYPSEPMALRHANVAYQAMLLQALPFGRDTFKIEIDDY